MAVEKVTQLDREVSATLIDMAHVTELEAQVHALTSELQEKHAKIEDLDKQIAVLQAKSVTQNENEEMKKINLDRMVLMKKLGDYKKAERNVKEIVTDYEQMKLKYFNVLTEMSSQKQHV